jgi:hypothetical protein
MAQDPFIEDCRFQDSERSSVRKNDAIPRGRVVERDRCSNRVGSAQPHGSDTLHPRQ